MGSTATLRDHLVDELNDLLNAEEQLIEALPKMAKNASDRQLKAAFQSHLTQTRAHAQRVSQALKALGEKPAGKTCEAMKGLLEEGEELMSKNDPGALLDAMMITAAQKVEHYEIATYGTVCTYANVLGERKVSTPLMQNLREEKAADKKLTAIAKGSVNRRASKEWHERKNDNMLEKGARWVGLTAARAVNKVRPRMMASASDSRPSRAPSTARSRSRTKAGARTE
jgi:ferritin-like metal-binding protein YciE